MLLSFIMRTDIFFFTYECFTFFTISNSICNRLFYTMHNFSNCSPSFETNVRFIYCNEFAEYYRYGNKTLATT